jgi:hypothetical protein
LLALGRSRFGQRLYAKAVQALARREGFKGQPAVQGGVGAK